MSIDFVVRDKLKALIAEFASITAEEAEEGQFSHKLDDFQTFCQANYKKFSNYVDEMVENDVSQGEYVEVLEKIKVESFELRNNLKLILQLFITNAKLFQEEYNKQEDWLNELNKLD
jgi:hypothetical protein